VQIDVRDGRVRVVAPLDGSPAQQAGLAPGDVLLAVDGRPVSAQSLQDVVSRVRGPRGTTVVLTLQREGLADPFDVGVTRGEIRTESVRARLIDDGHVAYVRVSTFAEPTGQQLRQHLKTLLEADPAGIVLDLRGNPGGRLAAAVEVASQFLREGVVLYQQRDPAGDDQRPYRASGNPVAPDTPLVVLVDHGSASASEIVAAALRDNNRAILIGERTFGKGTVQELHNLSDDSQIRVTIAQWLTPARRAIQGEGVVPDVAVERADPATGRDAALETALRHFDAARVATRG
jgi:carboxyl-terminal processing protease